ncbi:hypothetical protein BGX29_010129 [Mortierella sp. GBA35]|nr:hypothetical protein BGX29_010129 [Mortierella sp. GBA35]
MPTPLQSPNNNYTPQTSYTSSKPQSPTNTPQSPISTPQSPTSKPQSPDPSLLTPTDRQLTREKSLPSLPKVTRLYPYIFPKNVPRPSADIPLPAPGTRIESTTQLSLCKKLLSIDAGSADVDGDNTERPRLTDAQRDWLKSVQGDEHEQERIDSLLIQLVEEFFRDDIKESTAIAEILLVGPLLNKEYFRKLLNEFIRVFGEGELHDSYLLEGMVQLGQSAPKGHLHADDLVRILAKLRTRLEETHKQESEHQFYLTLAVSRVLDVMAEHNVEDLDRVEHRDPLLAILDVIRDTEDPYLLYQASYAFQALQYVPDEETALQAVLRHSTGVADGLIKATGIIKLDLGDLFDGLQKLQKTVSETYDVLKGSYEGARSLIQSGRGLFGALKEGFSKGYKRAWYPALRAADALVRAGRLLDFKRLILNAPCRKEPEFQWGVCQLLGEIAVDVAWDFSTRQQAASFLTELVDCGEHFTKDESVRLWMLTILRRVTSSSDQVIRGDDLRTLKRLFSATDDVLYPLVDSLPQSVSWPLLIRVQAIVSYEYELNNMRRQRLEGYENTIFIAPQGKANLLASDMTSFRLMDKVKQFLHGNRQVFLLLGDSGAGKSMFNRHLEYTLWKKFKKNDPIPLHINLPAINQPEQDMIAKQLQIYDFNEAQIMELKKTRQFIVICDGYDEGQLSTNLYASNALNQPGHWNVKMVISCRSTYLGQDYRHRFEPLSSDKYTPVTGLFLEAVIVPFSESHIRNYVEKFVCDKKTRELFGDAEIWSVDDYMDRLQSIPNMMELVKNPFLLSLSLKTLPSVYKENPDVTKIKATRLKLYDRFIQQWITISKQRLANMVLAPEVQAQFDLLLEEGFEDEVLNYSKNLAIHIMKYHAGNPVVQYRNEDKNTWKYNFFSVDVRIKILRESSPMTRAGNQHRFIHRSLVEYFYSRACVDDGNPDESDNEAVIPVDSAIAEEVYASEVQSDAEAEPESSSPARIPSRVRTTSPVRAPSPVKASSPGRTPPVAGTTSPGRTPPVARTTSPVRYSSPVENSFPISSRPQSLPPARRSAPLAPTMTVPADQPVRKLSRRMSTAPNNQLSEKSLVNEPSILQFLAERVQQDEVLRQQLFTHIKRSKTDARATIAAANAITILVRAGERFNGMDLSGVRIAGADLSGGDFDSVQLAGADLTGVKLTRAWLRHVNFRGAQMRDVQFGEWPYLELRAEVNTCAYSSDGKLFAIGFGGGAVSLFKTDTWEKVRDFGGHEWTVTALAFSPENDQLASSSDDKLVKLWNVKTGALEHTIGGQSETVASVVYSPKPQGRRIAAASHDSFVRLYDIPDRDPNPSNIAVCNVALTLKGHTGAVKSVAFSPSGHLIATASYDWTVRLWEPETGVQNHVLKGHTAWVTSVSISPTNNMVASSGQDMTVRLWNAITGAALYILRGHTAFVKKVDFSPSGHQLASGSGDHTVRLWDGLTGTPGPILSGHTQSVLTLAYAPDKQQIATGSWDSTVRLWDTHASALLNEQGPSIGVVETVASSPGDSRAGSMRGHPRHSHSSSSSIDFVTPAYAAAVGINSNDHTFSFSAVACSADSQVVATCSIDIVRLYNASTGASTAELRGHSNSVTSLAFSPDSQFLVTGSYDKTARIWKIQTGKCGMVFEGHTEAVTAVAFSPTGFYIATGSDDRTVRVWSARTGRVFNILSGHVDVVKSLSYSSDSQLNQLASGGGDFSVKLWNARTGTFDRDLKGHTNAIESVSFSTDGKKLASASRDVTARIWDVSTGQMVHELTGHRNAVTAIAFSPNNLRVATGGWDKTVRIWDVKTGRCLVEVTEFVGEVNSIAWKPMVAGDGGSMYFVTGCTDKSVRMWKLVEPGDAGGGHRVQLYWRSAFDGLMVTAANMQSVAGLSKNNQRLLEQRGAVGEPRWP